MQTSVNIISTNNEGKTITKSLTNINPETTNANLKQAAELFNAISKNTFIEAFRINKISLSTENE